MNRRNIIVAVIAAIVIIGLVVVLNRGGQQTPTATPVAAKANIQMTEQGFSPSTLTISKGTTVVWTNQDAKPHQVVADPYPSGSSLPELFAKQPTSSGNTYSYTFNAVGNWTYHDQLNPKVSGTIVVQ